MTRLIFKTSGFVGHEGRPGVVGGSLPRGDHSYDPEYEERRARARESLRAYRAKLREQQQQRQVQTQSASERYNIAEMFSSMPMEITNDMVRFQNSDASIRLAELQTRFPMLTEDMVKRMFYIKDMSARVSINSNGFTTYWYDKDGRQMVQQRIESDGSDAHFSYLSVEDAARAQNLGMPLVIKQVAMVKMLGFKTASMNADISIGKYAWAKEGVKYASDYRSTQARDSFNYFFSHTLTSEQQDRVRQDARWASFTEPWQWAQYKVPGVTINSGKLQNPDVKRGKYEIGKAFMLSNNYGHGSWDAVIDLSKIGF